MGIQGNTTQEVEFYRVLYSLEDTTGESSANLELTYLAAEMYLRSNVTRGKVVAEEGDFSIWEAQDGSFALWLKHKKGLGFII